MDPGTGARIQEALNLRKTSIRALFRALQGNPGRRSYPMIHRYLRGVVNPPIPFLEAVAELLKVRLEWLVTGKGERTTAEEHFQRARDAAVGIVQRRHAEEGIRESFPYYSELNFNTRNAVFQAWVLHFGRVYFDKSMGEIRLSDPQAQRELGKRIGRTLNTAIVELSVDPMAIHPVQFNNYVLILASALFSLADTPSVRLAANSNAWRDSLDTAGGMMGVSRGEMR